MSFPAPSAGRLPRTVSVESNHTVDVDLAVGDSVQVGDVICTVVDITGGEVCLRVDPADSGTESDESVRFAAVAR